MSLVIPIFVGGGEEGRGVLNFRGGSEKERVLQILDLQRLASQAMSCVPWVTNKSLMY